MKLTHEKNIRPDGTIELTVTIPSSDVASTYSHVVDEMVEQAELPGFRKGKAPRKMVEEKLDKSKVYEEVIRHLLPEVYNQVITEEKIKPIISPKVDLKEAKEGADWIIAIYTCERPNITMGDYKKAVREGKAAKQNKLWVPGQEKTEEKEEQKKPTLDEILSWILGTIDIKIPDLLLEQEVNRSLSQLIDQTKSLGLTVEQYLNSTGRNSDSIKKEYEEQAKKTIAVEFAIEDIADAEGIVVSDDDIDTVIKSAKTEQEKTSLAKERYYLATILRRQKTIDYLVNL